MRGLGARDERLRAAWEEAARDLGIKVSFDACWLLDADGERHAVIAVVQEFGARLGPALFSIDDFSVREMRASELRADDGYYASWLGPVYEGTTASCSLTR